MVVQLILHTQSQSYWYMMVPVRITVWVKLGNRIACFTLFLRLFFNINIGSNPVLMSSFYCEHSS